jgi:hypothetical protein
MIGGLVPALLHERSAQREAHARRRMELARFKQEALALAMKSYGSKCIGVSVELDPDFDQLVAVMICKSSIPKVSRKASQ